MTRINTMFRFHAGAGGSLGGMDLLSPSIKALMTRILNIGKCCLFCK